MSNNHFDVTHSLFFLMFHGIFAVKRTTYLEGLTAKLRLFFHFNVYLNLILKTPQPFIGFKNLLYPWNTIYATTFFGVVKGTWRVSLR